MKEALIQAQLAYQMNEVPVGAVIVKNNKIVAKAHNLTQKLNNPLMHAEILAINQACHILNTKYLNECDLYVTLEPCFMCAAAISLAKIKNVFYAASDTKFGAISCNKNFFHISQSTYKKPNIYSNIMEKNSSKIIKKFFKNLRNISK